MEAYHVFIILRFFSKEEIESLFFVLSMPN